VIVTLAWKECREQATVWVALTALAVAVLACLTATALSGSAAGPDAGFLVAAAAGLAITCGLVGGAQALAGEKEAGTLPFLDTLPALRRHVWIGKLLAGLALTLTQGLVVGAAAAWLGLQGDLTWAAAHGEAVSRWAWLWVLPAVALEAYCWGLLASALCRNVLVAVVLGAVMLAGPWLLATPPSWQENPLALLLRLGLALAALTASAQVFTGPDRERRSAPDPEAPPRPAAGPSAARVLLWLAARQGWGWLVALTAAAFVSALLMAGYGPVFWPVLTLVVGVVCGSTVFLAEQAEGTFRFLGDQRLPPGRVWLWKTAFWLTAAVAASVLVLVGGGVHAAVSAAHAPAAGGSGEWLRWLILVPPLAAAGLWLLYGFSAAQTCSLVWRRSVAALFMALVLSAAASSVWVPSVLGGGLPSWQVFVVPALLLAFNRLAVWAWAGDRFYTWRPLAGLALCVALAAAWPAACLGYRVLEVPDPGEPFEFRAFVASLPPPERNQAGSLIHQAVTRLKEQEDRAALTLLPANAPPGREAATAAGNALATYREQAGQVAQRGWTERDQDLGRWLDAVFQDGWADTLREGVAQPPGMVVDPRQTTRVANVELLQECQAAGTLFTARALQLQARGDDRAALDHLVAALALSRQLRSRGSPSSWLTALEVEKTALEGLDRWLVRLGPEPDLLQRALDEVARHEKALPPASDAVKADDLALQTTLDDPGELLRWFDGLPGSRAQQVTYELLQTAWEAPWEKARAARIVRATVAGRLRGVEAGYPAIALRRQAEEVAWWSPGGRALSGWLPAETGPEAVAARQRLARLIDRSWLGDSLMAAPDLPLVQAAGLCRVRGTRLQLTLALYEAREGKPAAGLDDLVPRYLPALPRDPFSPDGQGFSYRLSEGEDIEWGPQFGDEPVRHVAAGQGVVWSVGVDLTDNGGHRQGATVPLRARSEGQKGADWIFVVPRGAKRQGHEKGR
jgi:hypothetical protein